MKAEAKAKAKRLKAEAKAEVKRFKVEIKPSLDKHFKRWCEYLARKKIEVNPSLMTVEKLLEMIQQDETTG